jgi:hypothetical protein
MRAFDRLKRKGPLRLFGFEKVLYGVCDDPAQRPISCLGVTPQRFVVGLVQTNC